MEDLTGKQLGPYQIVAPLGEGGMAAVYKAYQPRMDRYVALKILPRHFAQDPEFINRFSQEARVIANLQHPHILPVHDFGEAEGYTYLTMRFVEGGTLADWLQDKQPLSLDKIRTIVTQVSGALDYAHAQGVIHRDIKPSNILVDQWDNCLLTDFGLAKMVESTIHLTQTGGILGTPAYMSPEQGLGQQIDHRSDIYSLGVLLYQMALGRLPYQAETPMAVVIKHIHDPLPPPRRYDPGLPEAVERVILKALAKDPEDRFAAAGDMARALNDATEPATVARPVPPAEVPAQPESAVAEPETVVAEPTPTPPTPETAVSPPPTATTPPKRRRSWLYAGLALIAVLVIGGLGLLLAGGGDEANGEDESIADGEADPANVEEQVALADELSASGQLPQAAAALQQAIDIAPDRPDLHCQLGYILDEIGDWEAAVNSFESCRVLAKESEEIQLQQEALGMRAIIEAYTTWEKTGDPQAALPIIDDALMMPDAPPWLICERAEINLTFDPQAAVSDFEVCETETQGDEYWPHRAKAAINMIYGYDALESEDYYSARDHFAVWSEMEPESPWPQCALGYAHTNLEEFDPAIEAFQRCSELAGEDVDVQQEAKVGALFVEAQIAKHEEDWPRALDHLDAALGIMPERNWFYCERGLVLQNLDRLEEARANFETCRDSDPNDANTREWAEELLRQLAEE